jgi:hypothetical protein
LLLLLLLRWLLLWLLRCKRLLLGLSCWRRLRELLDWSWLLLGLRLLEKLLRLTRRLLRQLLRLSKRLLLLLLHGNTPIKFGLIQIMFNEIFK